MRYPADGDEWRVVKTLAEEEGWRIVQVERYTDPWNTVQEAALIPGPLVTSRQLRTALPLLVEWRNRLRDAEGPVLGAEERADERAVAELVRIFTEEGRSFVRTAEKMSAHLEKLRETDPEEAEPMARPAPRHERVGSLESRRFVGEMEGREDIIDRWLGRWADKPWTAPGPTD